MIRHQTGQLLKHRAVAIDDQLSITGLTDAGHALVHQEVADQQSTQLVGEFERLNQAYRHARLRLRRNQRLLPTSSAQQAAKAALGFSALVIGRPITSWLAPAAIASAGPITRA